LSHTKKNTTKKRTNSSNCKADWLFFVLHFTEHQSTFYYGTLRIPWYPYAYVAADRILRQNTITHGGDDS